jgi:hypothetical protein
MAAQPARHALVLVYVMGLNLFQFENVANGGGRAGA